MRTIVFGTAGHIDHGKTALLRALTGIDADRLPEERRRGMTIDVGYAHLRLADGTEIDFVDVPGHDRLVGNMLVGAGEIDAVVLVVAADDGPRPQTLEHVELLDALGVTAGLAVVTKADLVSPDRLVEVVAAVRRLLARTALAGAEVVTASAVTGEGMDGVLAAILRARDVVGGAPGGAIAPGARGPVRLAIDRAFSVRGRGVVVTGSLRGSGTLGADAELRLEPGGRTVRVRELQAHGRSRASHEGGRVALNLASVPLDALRRGQVLTAGPGVESSDRWLVTLREGVALRAPAAGPRSGDRLRLHVGTDQADATIAAAGPRAGLAAGPFAVLRLDRPIAALTGERGVLREPAGGGVAAGVVLLDAEPSRGVARRRATAARLETLAAAVAATDPGWAAGALLDLHGAVHRDRLIAVGTALSASPEDPAIDVDRATAIAFAPDVRAALEDALLDAVAAHHRDRPISSGIALAAAQEVLQRALRALATPPRDEPAVRSSLGHLVDGLEAAGRLGRTGETLREAGRGEGPPPELAAAMDRLASALSVPAPPPLQDAAAAAGCPPEGIRELQRGGRIVRVSADLAWTAPTYQRLAATALELARAGPLSPAAFRDATGTSRRYVLAILEDLDRRGLLVRTPEGHIPGPRAPRRDPAA